MSQPRKYRSTWKRTVSITTGSLISMMIAFMGVIDFLQHRDVTAISFLRWVYLYFGLSLAGIIGLSVHTLWTTRTLQRDPEHRRRSTLRARRAEAKLHASIEAHLRD